MMSSFNTSTRREDMSVRLRAQNIKNAKGQTKRLEYENKKMEERLRELKLAMSREKEDREKQGGGFWRSGQTGTLNNYATEVLAKPTLSKEPKKKGVKVLKDEPLDVPERSSQPGTIKYIAQRPLGGKENKPKGPKCGQCEDRTASLTCIQCSEHYCTGCFAAFHLKGALKKHRSVPLQASGPRQCMSPHPTPPVSYRDYPKKPSPAAGAVSSSMSYQDTDRSGPEGASGSFDGPSLFNGQYDEADSAALFQQALEAWRTGQDVSEVPIKRSPRKTEHAVKAPVADSGTGTTISDSPPWLDIKFNNSISYADRLLLKKHRRTDVGELPTPRLDNRTPSRGSFTDYSDGKRVDFQALYQAVVEIESPRKQNSRSESSLSVIELGNCPSRENLHHIDHTDKYEVQEVSDFEAWATQNIRKSPVESYSEAKPPVGIKIGNKTSTKSKNISHAGATLSETDIIDLNTDAASPKKSRLNSRKSVHQYSGNSRIYPSISESEFFQNEISDLPKSRPQSRKSRPKSGRPHTGKQSRPTSRAHSRAASQAGEGVLTKTPSEALREIAGRQDHTENDEYTSAFQGFFLVGVKSVPEERTTAPLQNKKNNDVLKVSNRLYQMAPRSWRPDSSLGDSVPCGEVSTEEAETLLHYSYSKQMEGYPLEMRPASSVVAEADSLSRSETPFQSIPSPVTRENTEQSLRVKSRNLRNQPNKVQQENHPISRHSEKLATSRPSSTRPSSQFDDNSGRTSQAIVMDGEDLSKYDETEQRASRNLEDMETLDQLEWELASESGRITADGTISRLSMMEDKRSDSGSSRSTTPVVRLSMDCGYDINTKMGDEELADEVDENANQINDEEEVKALH